ncbi:uncharacterized protein LOC109821658 [Asparagus officinalis]|uniref:uncharacterized protein LOC109821658 n=1 Tax=Asparagus officinalis TaxID=4686 RepID=UPI00098E237F|nr:uncharacterized protein LOC109821658 [Asparagus officinalis]
MEKTYFPQSCISTANAKILDSGTWKFIIQSRDLVSPYLQWSDATTNWKWISNSTAGFTFSSAWNICRSLHPQTQFYDILWHPKNCPKFSHCLYKALINRLPTRERLCKIGIIQESSCILCKQDVETTKHLFFECEFSKYIWSLSRLKIGINSPQMGSICEEALLIQQRFKGKSCVYTLPRLVLAGATWHIWQERNRRVFHHQELSKIMVFRRLYEDILVLMRTCQRKIGNDREKAIIMSNWS